MIHVRRATVAALLLWAAPAAAQTEVVAPPTPNADRLADEIRRLTRDPLDIDALISAGELSAKLDEMEAARGFFARAEAVSPGDPRIGAGRARMLVRQQKPGEALRLWAEAERAGVSMRPYAADRGFAYDLVGAPELAQRDYRIAMESARDDETLRRYALSLGISGERDEAMTVLDPLLRRSDRPAWRARAFILAMTGDIPGAERIAQSMMPANMGAALAPFFARLAAMAPADRAYAVHFGELSRTPARAADAALAPPLPRVERPPVAVAAVQPPRATPPAPETRRPSRRQRQAEERAAAERAERERLAQEARALAARQTAEREARERAEREAQELAARQAAEREAAARAAAAPPRPVAPEPAPVQLAAAELPAAVPAAAEALPEPPSADAPAETAAALPDLPAPDRRGPDPVLAAIVAGIVIPASELDVAPLAQAEAPPAATGGPKPVAAAEKPPAAKPAAKPPAKKEPPKPDPKKTEPARHWVQVAGGADVKALPREWKRLLDKAPAEFKGKQAWTTPLRFTNRLLAGPFKNEGEAQGFVNLLGKKGISAFAWTSAAGQKIEKLAVK